MHPCFSSDAVKKFGRVHLPVAPECNIQCNYCSRDYDCVNESRPGVTSTLMKPEEASYYYATLRSENEWLTVAGIAGPGDALANADKTMETFRLIKEETPDVVFCVSTNGLRLPEYVDELHSLGLRHLTVTMNAVDPEIGAQIYSWVRYNGVTYRGKEAAELLMNNQIEGIRRAAELGLSVKVNSIILPGVNDEHIKEVAALASELGATYQNCLPLIPVESTPFEHLPKPDHALVKKIRTESEKFLPQMLHCGRCRSDAVGKIGQKTSEEILQFQKYVTRKNKETGNKRYAVATHEGLLVNQHLGEARKFHIYEFEAEGLKEVEQRTAPRSGSGESRWKMLAELLSDCEAVFVSTCGELPKKVLSENGVRLHQVQGLIDDILETYESGKSIERFAKKRSGCGSGCSGQSVGCM